MTERTWTEKQEKWIAAMEAAGEKHEHKSFDADHGFVNPMSPATTKRPPRRAGN